MSLPNNYEIFNYWKDKQFSNRNVIVTDWLEPSCWCCSKPIQVETPEMIANEDFKKVWNRTRGKLERCHIIPKALGGPDTPDNLFLLCPSCHRESPDTISKEMFLSWIEMKRQKCILGVRLDNLIQEVTSICKHMNVNMYDFLEFASKVKDRDIENKTNTHGAEFILSSYLMIIMKIYLERIGIETDKEEAVPV